MGKFKRSRVVACWRFLVNYWWVNARTRYYGSGPEMSVLLLVFRGPRVSPGFSKYLHIQRQCSLDHKVLNHVSYTLGYQANEIHTLLWH